MVTVRKRDVIEVDQRSAGKEQKKSETNFIFLLSTEKRDDACHHTETTTAHLETRRRYYGRCCSLSICTIKATTIVEAHTHSTLEQNVIIY
eukprot:scaffold4626_cov110-Skeletonema_dohrnii-CCMP3373.AAC.7